MFAASKTDGSSELPDPQFNYVTMLLHGDGTNGAQNNTFLDSGPNTFTITRNGNTTQGSFSPYGSNWSFNNPDAIGGISVPTSTALDLGTGDFTIEAWVNTSKLPTTNAFQTSSGGYQNIFGTGPDSNPTGTSMYIGVTNLKFEITADGSGPIDVAHNMVAGVWYHIAVSRSGTTFRAFINGSLVQTGTSSASANNGYGWGIMRSERIGAYDGAWWFGSISNFRVVKGTAVYTSAFTPPTAPLTAISGTSLLTCQSNRFIDTSSTAATVTVAGSTSVQRFNPFGTSTAYSTSVIGGSGYFDGSGDNLIAVSANTANAMGTGDWTAEAWIYLTTGGGTPFVFDTLPSGSGSATGLRMRLNSSNQLQLWQYGSAVLTSSASVTVNAWTHVALVKSSGTTTAYVNGTASNTYSDSGNYICGTNRPMIGSDGFNNGSENSFPGYISNLRLVKGTAVYTSSFTPNTAPLSAITNTSLLLSMTNGAIFDNAMMNDLETVGNAQISTSVKKYGTGSLAFDGSGDYLYFIPTPQFVFGAGNFTVEAWTYFNDTTTSNAIISQCTTSGDPISLDLFLHSSEYFRCRVVISGTTYTVISSTITPVSTWQHVAMVRDGSTLTLYLNGTSVGSTSIGTGSLGSSSTNRVAIGRLGEFDGQYMNGYIDDLRITKGFARYTTTFTPPTSALSDTGPY